MITIILVLITLIYLLYKLSTNNYDYWKKRNVLYPHPLPFFGNALNVILLRTSIGRLLANFYNTYKTPYFGIFIFNKPCLVLRSRELIKHILVKDFNNFTDRTLLCNENIDPVAANLLFVARNPKWKYMRSIVSPAFSGRKLKMWFPLLNSIASQMNSYIFNNRNKPFIEAKELCAKYATEFVATCAFGITGDCFVNESSEFRKIGKKMFSFDVVTTFRQTCYFFFHSLATILKIPFLDESVSRFLRNVVSTTIIYREKSQSSRNDVIDLMIKTKNDLKEVGLFDNHTIAAQAGQFFTAGLDTVSTTMSFTLYELALQPDIQKELRLEIKTNLERYGTVTYDGMQELKYMDMVICETLRKYPVLPFLDRVCTEDYKIPDSDLVIEKGTRIYIPMIGLHYDPEYFPNPEHYEPERFSEEKKNEFYSFSYFPFGEGPRICIGKRLGMMVSKLGLYQLLSEYEVITCKETPVPIEFETKGFLIASVIGLPLCFRKSPVVA